MVGRRLGGSINEAAEEQVCLGVGAYAHALAREIYLVSPRVGRMSVLPLILRTDVAVGFHGGIEVID